MGRSYAHTLQQFGPLAQGLEQRTHNPSVVGSNPTGPTQLRVLHSFLGPVSLRPPPRRCTHAHLAAALASKSYRAHFDRADSGVFVPPGSLEDGPEADDITG